MHRIISVTFLCFLALSMAGCLGLNGSQGQYYMDNNCHHSVNLPDGWNTVETFPLKYKDLPGTEDTEKILKIISNPDGSGIILFTTENIPMPMYEFQKGIYDLMAQREKDLKANKAIKKYRCMNSYKSYGEVFGIESYYEYWKFQDSQKDHKGIRQTYFIPNDENSICSVSKILYSNFVGYDNNLVAFSDINLLEND